MVRPTKSQAKLPLQQLWILAVCRFCEPIALTSVYPYLPEMIESFNIPTDKVAKWAGLASAIFSFSQCLTAIIWGQMSDRYGRKYLILLSLSFTAVTSILFGLSKSLSAMLIARAIGGAGSGTVGIIRTMVAEMVPHRENQTLAFSIMPIVWSFGSILGPAFGGALANPWKRYRVFDHSRLLKNYPFLLPNLVAGIFFLIGLTVGVLFLRETLEAKKNRRDFGLVIGNLISGPCRTRRPRSKSWQSEESDPFLGEDSTSSPLMSSPVKSTAYKRPSYRDVLSPQSNINLGVYTLLAMHSQAFDQLLPIFMHHPPQNIHDPGVKLPLKFAGGFGLSSSRIGLLFTLYGVVGMFVQFLCFPPIAKRYGVLRCLRVLCLFFPIIYILIPFTALMPTSGGKQAAIFLLMLCKSWCGIFAFPCSTILLTNSAASLSILGTLNGVATSTSALGRAAGPFTAGAIFTWGVHRGYVIAAWWSIALISMLAAVPVFWLKEGEGFAATGDNSEDEEDDSEREYSVAMPSIQQDMKASRVKEDAMEDGLGPPLKPASSRPGRNRGFSALERRMSSPIGMGDISHPTTNGRRFSTNLGATRSGFGTGGEVGNST